MSKLKVDNIVNLDGTTGPIIDSDCEFSSSYHMVLPKGTTAQRPSNVLAGSIRYNTETKSVEQYNGTSWTALNSYTPGRGVFASGYSNVAETTFLNNIEYLTISTTASVTDFGDLYYPSASGFAVGNCTKGIYCGGSYPATAPKNINYSAMETFQFSTTGNAAFFGSLCDFRIENLPGSCSNNIRGYYAGGFYRQYQLNIETSEMGYITFANDSTFNSFGNLAVALHEIGGCSSPTRGFFCGGDSTQLAAEQNTIQFITFSSLGNAGYFGDLTISRGELTACSSSTRGICIGGDKEAPATPVTKYNTIDYITLSTGGNAILFGNMTNIVSCLASCSNSIRGVYGGGSRNNAPSETITNVVEYVNFATLSNPISFGNLIQVTHRNSACSDSHGGLV